MEKYFIRAQVPTNFGIPQKAIKHCADFIIYYIKNKKMQGGFT